MPLQVENASELLEKNSLVAQLTSEIASLQGSLQQAQVRCCAISVALRCLQQVAMVCVEAVEFAGSLQCLQCLAGMLLGCWGGSGHSSAMFNLVDWGACGRRLSCRSKGASQLLLWRSSSRRPA
jgi:hypothetical protein